MSSSSSVVTPYKSMPWEAPSCWYQTLMLWGQQGCSWFDRRGPQIWSNLIAECANYDLHSGFIYTAHPKKGNSWLSYAFDVDVHFKVFIRPVGLVKLADLLLVQKFESDHIFGWSLIKIEQNLTKTSHSFLGEVLKFGRIWKIETSAN
jgi:hypothetical protein